MDAALWHWMGLNSTTHKMCPQCRTRLRSGETEYHHIVLCATLVGIGHSEVLPLRPQFITPQDGDQKPATAAYRWFDQNAARYASLRPHDLYPITREKVTQAGDDFIFRAKKVLIKHFSVIAMANQAGGPRTQTAEFDLSAYC